MSDKRRTVGGEDLKSNCNVISKNIPVRNEESHATLRRDKKTLPRAWNL
jgi:hypothetical protein